MDAQKPNDRLSQITTAWSLLQQAHANDAIDPNGERQALLNRYYGAVYRYLLGATRDEEAALELFQDFAVRFLRGDFRGANAARGRFRDYLKTSLIHMVTDYRRAGRLRPVGLHSGGSEIVDSAGQDDVEFVHSWREEIINQAWKALHEQHPTHYAALALHVEQPDSSSDELATQLAQRFGRTISAGNVRVILHRSREKFAELLVERVALSLASPSRQQLKHELQELHLLSLCQTALQQWQS